LQDFISKPTISGDFNATQKEENVPAGQLVLVKDITNEF
jgi:hypothetical protein